MMENVEKPTFNLISPSHIKNYQFNILLHYLRAQRINHLLAENGLIRRNATATGNNCLLDTYFQQIHHYVATNFPGELIKLGSLPEFIQFIRKRIGKANEEMLSANDELEGLQLLSAAQAYLQNRLNMNVGFNLTVLFADNDGEISLVDTSSLNNYLQQGNICIPMNLICINYNHYEPVFPLGTQYHPQPQILPNNNDDVGIENRLSALQINLLSEKPLPAYVVNIPVKVDSDSDNESSPGEEDDQSFSASMFTEPEKYFRLLSPQLPAKDKKGNLKKDKNNEQKYKKVYQRGRISDEFLPITNQTTLKSIDEEKDTPSKISKIFQKEAFGKSTIESRAETNKRLAISYGLNKMRSLSRSRNRTLLQVLDKPATNGISVHKVGFFWEGSWQRFNGDQQQWQAADFDTVRKFYRQLKKKNKKKADEFRKETEKRRGHMVPYREIREKLKSHENTKALVRELRLKSPSADIYLAFLDSDLKSLRNPGYSGTFSIYDENYLAQLYQGNILEIASTGYTIRESGNPLLELGVLCDLWIRHFTAAYIKVGVYYPEPCSIVRVLPTAETVQESFTIIGESNYESPKEMPILIDNVLAKRKLNPQTTMAFDARGAITTTTPDRMRRDFGATVSQKQRVILWRLADFKTMRDINQSHFNPRDWAINLLHAFKIPKEISFKVDETNYTLKDQKVIKDVLISLLSRLFNVFDPIAIAEAQSQAVGNGPFQKCLINLLNNYESFVFGSVKSTTRDYEKKGKNKNKTKADAVTALWKKADGIDDIASLKQMINAILSLTESNQLNANYIETAIQAGLKKIVELFKIKLSLNYEELTLNLFSELFSDNDVQTENLYDQLPYVYKLIMSNTLLENKSTAIASFKQFKEVPYGILPLHLAAITGNMEAIQWCLEKLGDNKIGWVGDITLTASGNILPLHCAVKHCAANGNNLHLLELLCDAETVTATMNNGLTIVEMIINELDDPLPILEWLFSEYEDDIESIDSDLLTVDYATLLMDAIKGNYGNVAQFLAQFDDCEDEITNAILDMAPDIDDKLIEWARENDYDFEWIIDQLCESEQALFKVNLGFYADDAESEINDDNYSLDDAYENENPFIEDEFDFENDPTEETFLNLIQSELNNHRAYDESDEQKTAGRILNLSYKPDYDQAFSHLDGIERMELIKILYQRFRDRTLRHRPQLTNVNQSLDYSDLKNTYKEKYLKNQTDAIPFQFFNTARNPIDELIYKLRNNTLTELDLLEAKVQPDDFIRLMNALKTNNSVSTLGLSYMELQIKELPDGRLPEIYFRCIDALSETLVNCGSLTTIYLWNSSLTNLHADSTQIIVSAAKANSHITKIIVNTDYVGGQDDVNDINNRPLLDKRNDRI